MEARPYRRRPRAYFWAKLFGFAGIGLFLFGLFLELLPENGSLEWNGLPLGEYGVYDLLPTIVVLAFIAIVFAGFAFRGELGSRQRALLIGIITVAGICLGLVALGVGFLLALCHNGCN